MPRRRAAAPRAGTPSRPSQGGEDRLLDQVVGGGSVLDEAAGEGAEPAGLGQKLVEECRVGGGVHGDRTRVAARAATVGGSLSILTAPERAPLLGLTLGGAASAAPQGTGCRGRVAPGRAMPRGPAGRRTGSGSRAAGRPRGCKRTAAGRRSAAPSVGWRDAVRNPWAPTRKAKSGGKAQGLRRQVWLSSRVSRARSRATWLSRRTQWPRMRRQSSHDPSQGSLAKPMRYPVSARFVARRLIL